jgi:predicted  nucleic acid-binding Zn-ribbon protein
MALVALGLVSGRTAFSSEVVDLQVKLSALEDQMHQEKDKAKKEDLKKQETQLKEQLKAAKEKEKVASKSAEKSKDKPEQKTASSEGAKSEAQGLNKFSRFWTQEVGKPMRHFFHGN